MNGTCTASISLIHDKEVRPVSHSKMVTVFPFPNVMLNPSIVKYRASTAQLTMGTIL